MGIFILILCITFYYCAIFLLTKYTLQAFSINKYKKGVFIASMLIFSIPMFCIIDYIWRGNAFVEAFVIPGYLITAFLIYYLMTIFCIIFIRFLWNKTKKKSTIWLDKLSIFSAAGISILICCIGIACAQIPEYSRHSFEFGLTKEMKIVVVSDMHYGSTGSMLSLKSMVDHINQEEPDAVFLVGDVFDNAVGNVNHQEFVEQMNQLKSTYGTFAVTGNHEFMQNDLNQIKGFYEGTNIRLLLDEEITLNDELRLVGRIDHRVPRKPLTEIVSDSKLPLIVLDHQPQYYREATEVQAKLQISGHTHNGQIFPGNLLIYLMNRILYNSPTNGIHSFEDFSLAITRGYGTWGFPMRLTGASQIMVFSLK